jgi:hypothetical protein
MMRAMAESDLRLVALWDVDAGFQFTGLQIACPRGELRDGTVDCAWTAAWNSDLYLASAIRNTSEQSETVAVENDLDGIIPVGND